MHQSNSKTFLAAALAVIGICAAPASAGSLAPEQFTFTGICSDCAGIATGTLTLTGDYVPGDTFGIDQFISFTYDGSNLFAPFTINAGDPLLSVSGTIPIDLPGTADLDLSSYRYYFYSVGSGEAVGEWGTGLNEVPFDQGVSHSFSVNAPEPGSLALIGFGLVSITFLKRRKRVAAQQHS